MTVASRRLALVFAALVALGGCSAGDAGPQPPISPGASLLTAPPVPSLPPGNLSDRVLQPADVPRGLVPILSATGPADIRRIAGFSANPAGAAAALRANGFLSAYVVQYADPDSGRVISNVVVRFATPAGASADIRSDIRAAAASGTVVDLPTIGDESGVIRQGYPAGSASPSGGAPPSGAGSPSGGPPAAAPSDGGELMTARFRVGALTYLLAVGTRGTVPAEELRRLADVLVARAGA